MRQKFSISNFHLPVISQLLIKKFKNSETGTDWKSSKAFTLVELLVVITLIGIIALVVLAAINPIEQANRARDTRFTTEASSLLSAIERYYVGRAEFPWVTSGAAAANDTAFNFVSAGTEAVGICGTTCSDDGLLISNEELRTEFRNKDFIKNNASAGTDNTKVIFVGKATGNNATVYACFIPLSRSTRQKACNESNVYTISGAARTLVPPATCQAASYSWTGAGATGGSYVCLPQ